MCKTNPQDNNGRGGRGEDIANFLVRLPCPYGYTVERQVLMKPLLYQLTLICFKVMDKIPKSRQSPARSTRLHLPIITKRKRMSGLNTFLLAYYLLKVHQ